MIIDRHNYEECFILYWDDELTASQKQAVENFVKENDDLQEEFRLLGETRFTPDNNIQLEEKEFLQNNSFINITNYEEQLLNYVDDEINPDQKKEVEKFVAQYPAGQRELALLQKTKLQPEAEMVFPDKSILYRREEKVRVISMTWFRVAVAAAIILIAGLTTFRLINTNKNEVGPVVNVENSKETQPGTKIDPLNNINPADRAKNDTKDNLVKTGEKTAKEQSINTDKKVNKSPVDKQEDSKNLVINQPENKNNLPKERIRNDQTIAQTNNPEEVIAYNISKENYKAEKSGSGNVDNALDNSSVTKSSFASLDNIPIDESSDNLEKDKGGLKGFLRKTTRVFERRTKIQTTTDDNKLLVGAFAVSLK